MKVQIKEISCDVRIKLPISAVTSGRFVDYSAGLFDRQKVVNPMGI